MRAYYLEGDNIEWLIGVCLILFVIGVVGALAMFVIPEKINLRVCRANVFFFSALMAVVAFVTLIVFTSRSFTMDELEAGRHWKNDCKLLGQTCRQALLPALLINWTVMASSLMCQVNGIMRISISGNYTRRIKNESKRRERG